MQTQPPAAQGEDALNYITYTLYAVLGAAVLSLMASQTKGIVAAIGIGGLVFLAALAGGGVLGFLFAVPRVLSSDSGQKSDARAASRSRLQSNTNLERISDWLTTMLVGVGLSQIHKLNDALIDFRHFIAESARVFNGSAGALPAVAPLLLIVGIVAGFVTMYLHTRLVLVRVFISVEQDLGQPLIGAPKRVVLREARAAEQDGSALTRAIADTPEPTLNDALDLMFDLLYKPHGYESVLTIGEELKGTEAVRNPNYWFYLAAAYGQKLTAAIDRKAAPAEINATTKAALDCAKSAVQLDSSFARRLWFISNPNGSDNDLQSLRDNAEFMKLAMPKDAEG